MLPYQRSLMRSTLLESFVTQSSGCRPFSLLLLIELFAIRCGLVLLLIGSGLFLPLVACLCGGADLEAFSMSRVALAIGLPKSLGNMVVWVRTLGIMNSYSLRITIWDPRGILSAGSLFSCKARSPRRFNSQVSRS